MSNADNYCKVHLSGRQGFSPMNEIITFRSNDPDDARRALRGARALAQDVSRPGHTASVSVWRMVPTVPSSVRVVGVAPEVKGADLNDASL